MLLTAGVLAEPRTLAALERVLAADAAAGVDRVVLVRRSKRSAAAIDQVHATLCSIHHISARRPDPKPLE